MLNLTVANSTGGSEDVVVEMSKRELEEAITALSKASEVVKTI